MQIRNNITAMNTHRMYTMNNDAVAASAKKLSSGYRINSAADDAAGLAISEKMRSQIRGLNMATKNSQDAISLVQTAEGALQETQNMLQRMNELAVQAATGTNETLDRNALAKEFEQLKREINDIAEQTNFNNMKILDGSLSYEGLKRSAATSGIVTTTENISAKAPAISEVTSGRIEGSNYSPSTTASGASVSFSEDALLPSGSSITAEHTYNLNVDLGGGKSVSVKGTAAAGDTTMSEVLAKAGTVTDDDGNEYKVETTQDEAGAVNGLKLTRTDTSEVVTLNPGITATLSEQVGDTVKVAETTTPVDAANAHKAGWTLNDAAFKTELTLNDVGKTFTVELTDDADAKNKVQLQAEVKASDVGKTVGQILAEQQTMDSGLEHTDKTNSSNKGDKFTLKWDDISKDLHVEYDSALGNDGDLPATKLTAKMTQGVEQTGAGNVFADAAAATDQAKLDIDLTATATKGQKYSLSFVTDQGIVTVESDEATSNDQTIGELFGSVDNIKLPGATAGGTKDAELKMVNGGVGMAGTVGKVTFLADAGETDVGNVKIYLNAAQKTDTEKAVGSDVAGAKATGDANAKVTLPANGGATPPEELGKGSVDGNTYELSFTTPEGKTVTLTAEGDSSKSIAQAFADKYNGNDLTFDIDGEAYRMDVNTTDNKLELIAVNSGVSTAAAIKDVNLSTFVNGDEIKNNGQEDGKIDAKGSPFALASKEYGVTNNDLMVGDSVTIDGIKYTVGAESGELSEDGKNQTIGKKDFLNDLMSAVNANSGDKLTMEPVKDGEDEDSAVKGFKLTETAKAATKDAVDDETKLDYGKDMQRSEANLDAKFDSSSVAKKTTIEIDAVKLKAGDTVSVKVGDNEYTYKVQDGDKAKDIIAGLSNEKLGKLTAEGGEAVGKGNAIIVEGKDVDVETGFIARTENDDAYNAVRIQVGALEGEQLSISIDAMNTAGLGLDSAHLMDPNNKEGLATLDQDAAGAAITATRAAINKISDQRATLGAMQNRLDHKIANLKISSENLAASESRIRDVDMASEMTNFTKNNILSQAATAMLAQANALPQNVLSLLG